MPCTFYLYGFCLYGYAFHFFTFCGFCICLPCLLIVLHSLTFLLDTLLKQIELFSFSTVHMYKEVPSRVFLDVGDVSSTGDAFPAIVHGFNPMKYERVSEKEVMGGEKANEVELAEKYKDEIDSWLSLSDDEQNNKGTSWGEFDKDLDLKEYNPCFENQYQVHYNPQQCCNIRRGSTGSESLVPLSFAGASEQHQEQWRNFSSGMEYEMSKARFVHDPLRSQSVSVPFMDAGIVPEATMSSISADSYRRNPEWLFGIHSSTTLPMQPNLAPMIREAKVQRYREKRKARKFEKKIRYASRQAYAETRPRVKGKFAREIDKECELGQMFLMDAYPHGIGPSS